MDQGLYGAHRSRRSRIARVAGYVVAGLVVVAGLLLGGLSLGTKMPIYATPRPGVVGQASSSLVKFAFQPGRVQTGVVYHYIKSNIDGSTPADVSMYVASPTRIEVFKLYPNASATALVTAEMDWRLFSPSVMESYDVHADGLRTPVVSAHLSAGDSYEFRVDNLLWVKGKVSSAPIGHYPVHNYNFDLASLNFSFRHLVDPTGEFEVGMQMPCFDLLHLGSMEYLGRATIQYQGEETCHGRLCRRYVIGGEAFGQQQGYLWVNKEGGYFEKVEIPVRDNPSWKDFKLELTSVEQMSAQQWNTYIDTQTAAFLK